VALHEFWNSWSGPKSYMNERLEILPTRETEATLSCRSHEVGSVPARERHSTGMATPRCASLRFVAALNIWIMPARRPALRFCLQWMWCDYWVAVTSANEVPQSPNNKSRKCQIKCDKRDTERERRNHRGLRTPPCTNAEKKSFTSHARNNKSHK